MDILLLIIKGFLIGLAKVIPGVSGSLIAISMGLYERGITAISSFFKNVKENSLFLLNVGIGVLIAIMLGSNLISFLLLNYYVPTMFTFIGLISGTIPSLIKKENINKLNYFIIIILAFSSFFVFSSIIPQKTFVPNNDLFSYLFVSFLGFLDALTMIIPGISGTAIFMIIGCYPFILKLFGNLTNISYLVNNIYLYIFFIIGLFGGIIIVTKIVNYLLKNYKKVIYSIIIGFALSSIVMLINTTLVKEFSFLELIISILLLLLGYKISKTLE